MKKVICKLIETDTLQLIKERSFNAMDTATQRSVVRSVKNALGVSDLRHITVESETGYTLQLYGVRMLAVVTIEDLGKPTIEKKWEELRNKGSVQHEQTI